MHFILSTMYRRKKVIINVSNGGTNYSLEVVYILKFNLMSSSSIATLKLHTIKLISYDKRLIYLYQ